MPKLQDHYPKTIQADLENGFIRKLSPEEAQELRSKSTGLPHTLLSDHPTSQTSVVGSWIQQQKIKECR